MKDEKVRLFSYLFGESYLSELGKGGSDLH